MSLRQKFFVVLALLGLTLGANVALSVWSIRFLERELAWPMRSAQPVLEGLLRIKRAGEEETRLLGAGRVSTRRTGGSLDPKSVAPRLIEQEQRVLKELEALDSAGSVQLRSGVSTTTNLRERSRQIMRDATRWESSGPGELRDALIGHIEDRHELIERIEGRMLEDAALANTYGQRLRVLIMIIIAIAALGAVLVTVFLVVLLRRWVLEPVKRLRVGAQHYARAEFEHRIDVHTGDELGQLGDEFNNMASTISAMQDERIERERLAAMGEMAQRTVHNLRTPLAGIRALAETTQSELDPESDLREVQERIIATVDRFEGWLQGMLRVSSPLQLHLGEYDPVGLVRGVIDSHKGAAQSRSVGLVLDVHAEPGGAIGDAAQLEHAATALLSNAIDYAPSGSAVELGIGTEPGYWTLRVRDHGPGIPSELQRSIFRAYFTTRKGGTGIGLALVKRIVDQHNGSIEVRSPVNGDSEPGTAFFVRIPLDMPGDGKS